MARQVVFIASRAHSGSTFLNLLLSGQPRLVALGEVFNLFDFEAGHIYRQEKILCSCGESMSRCKFWGPLTDQLRAHPDLSPGEMYDLVLDAFYAHFGEDAVPVDASKTVDALRVLKDRPVDLRVIFLIRDVRPWVVSMRKNLEKRARLRFSDLIKKYGLKAPFEWLMTRPVKFFWHWYLLNRQTQRFLTQEDISTLQMGYEELCFYPEMMLAEIGNFLGLPFDPEVVSLGTSEEHIILGNRMRRQPEKRARIYYDHRWFNYRAWLLPSLLFRRIMNYNDREVYRNTSQHEWLRK